MSERVAIRGERNIWLDGTVWLGASDSRKNADYIVDRLNVAFDETAKDARQQLLDEKLCCGIHAGTELIDGLGCSRCGDTFHCPVCCMEATREEACNLEIAADGMRVVLEELGERFAAGEKAASARAVRGETVFVAKDAERFWKTVENITNAIAAYDKVKE